MAKLPDGQLTSAHHAVIGAVTGREQKRYLIPEVPGRTTNCQPYACPIIWSCLSGSLTWASGLTQASTE